MTNGARTEVAVLGAGIMGCCLALELARRGYGVELIDLAAMPMTGASLHNEGKLHLGFVYANDPSRETHGLMVRGSLAFAHIIERLTGHGVEALRPSTPFHYFVPRDSLLDEDAILSHFHSVEQAALEHTRTRGDLYLGQARDRYFERNTTASHARLFSPRTTRCSFRTEERSVSPAAVADILRRAIQGRANISFVGNASVLSARILPDGGVCVETSRQGQTVSSIYAGVANCLWDDKLRVDGTAGVVDPAQWFLRYKATITIPASPDGAGIIPSATGILGAYGDVVNNGDGSIYISWYPLCRRAQTGDVDGRKLHDKVHTGVVPRAIRRLVAGQPSVSRFVASIAHRKFIRDNLQAMTTYVPSLAGLLEGRRDYRIGGGVIMAKGSTDIHDPASHLHQRSAIGPVAHGSYVTINTGKYCMAPLFAMEAADLLAGVLG